MFLVFIRKLFSSAFHTIDCAKNNKIQMSKVEYLQASPDQFDKLVKYVNDAHSRYKDLPKVHQPFLNLRICPIIWIPFLHPFVDKWF